MRGEDRRFVELVGYEWEEAEDLAAELGVEIVRVTTGAAGAVDAPHRVIRQRWRGDVLELTTAPEGWTS